MRIAGKDWTTLAAIKEMMEKCLARPKEHISGCGQLTAAKTLDGSSRTVDVKLAQAAALETVRTLKEISRNYIASKYAPVEANAPRSPLSAKPVLRRRESSV